MFLCSSLLPKKTHLSHISLVSSALFPASLLLHLVLLVSSSCVSRVVPSLFVGFCPRVSPVSPACHALPLVPSLCASSVIPPTRPPFAARFCRLPIVHSFGLRLVTAGRLFSPGLPLCLAVGSFCLNRDARRITGLITRSHKL